jgi:hypothetical protein
MPEIDIANPGADEVDLEEALLARVGSSPISILGYDDVLSGDALEVSGLNLADYSKVVVILEDVVASVAGLPLLTVLVGGVEVTTGYYYAHRSLSNSGAGETAGGTDAASVPLLDGTTSGPWYPIAGSNAVYGGEVTFIGPASSNHKPFQFAGTSTQGSTGALVDCNGSGALRNTGAITGFKLSHGGTMSGARMTVIGYKRTIG